MKYVESLCDCGFSGPLDDLLMNTVLTPVRKVQLFANVRKFVLLTQNAFY